MTRILRLAAPLALAAVAACADHPGAFEPPLVPEPARTLATIECTVRPAAGDMRCAAPTPKIGASADLIVGGQGTYVQLRSSNVAYDTATRIFGADVTLQNLLGQPVGTEDGVTASGIRIFFYLLPAVTAGSGTVEVENYDGQDIFTELGQPYFYYPDILAPYERTGARRWEWSVPRTVEEFTFQVSVSARVPNEAGVLRWTRERGDITSRGLMAVWGTGPNDIWAGGAGVMMYNNGTRWVVIPGDWDGGVTGIWGSASDDVWAVGGQLLRRFDGRRWRKVTPPVNENFSGVWGSGPNDVYVTGGAFGWVLRWDGAGWDTVFTAVQGRRFQDVWASGPDDVFLVGYRFNPATKKEDGYAWHWDGVAWDSTAFVGTDLRDVWGTSGSDVYAVGGGGHIYRYDGAQWTRVGAGVTPFGLNAVWGTGPDDVWAVGGGYHGFGAPEATVLHYDGTAWSEVQTGGAATATAVFAPNPDKVYVLGQRGMIQKRSGNQWQAETSGSQEWLTSVWPLGDDDALMTHCGVGVQRKTGVAGAWETVYPAPDDCLRDVWATAGGARIFAVGHANSGAGSVIARWDGTEWTRTEFPDVRELRGVWGLGADAVYAVGYRDAGSQTPVVLRWDGTEWTEMDTGQSYGQLSAVWASSPDDVYAVGTHVLRWNGVYWTSLGVHDMGDQYEDVWGTGPDDVYVTGAGVYHWNGGAWSAFFPRLNYRGYGVWGSGPNDVYVVGTQSLHFNGTSWTEVNLETSSTLHDVGGVSARQVWAVGEGGVVMRGRR